MTNSTRHDTLKLKRLSKEYIAKSNYNPKFFLRCNFLKLERSYVSLFIMRIHKADYTVDSTDCSDRWGKGGGAVASGNSQLNIRYSADRHGNGNFISSRITNASLSVPLTRVYTYLNFVCKCNLLIAIGKHHVIICVTQS